MQSEYYGTDKANCAMAALTAIYNILTPTSNPPHNADGADCSNVGSLFIWGIHSISVYPYYDGANPLVNCEDW